MHTLTITKMYPALLALAALAAPAFGQTARYYELPARSGPHDVAPAPDGTVWYTAQRTGHLGRLDPRTGKVDEIPLGRSSAPHGVIVGPDGAAWVTDGGQNAVIRVDPATRAVRVFPLPEGTPYTNMNTAAFDGNGVLWWTGQSGYYGSVNPMSGETRVMDAPKGRGPYGITATPKGDIYYVSLAGSHLAKIDTSTGEATVIEPPTPRQGARRVWSDSRGRLWISEWLSGQLSVYDPVTRQWKAWKPSEGAQIYAIYVDENDKVWISEWSTNAILSFDPLTEKFERFPSDRANAQVRQMLGRAGEVWGAESGTDRLVVIASKARSAAK
jgi:virginiamycin B lyase